MTFDQAQQQSIHVVSYPSVWLSDHHTLRLFVWGMCEAQICALIPQLQTELNRDLTIYTPHTSDAHNAQLLDWCQFMCSLCDHVIHVCDTLADLAVCAHLPGVHTHWVRSQDHTVNKLVSVNHAMHVNVAHAILHATLTHKDEITR